MTAGETREVTPRLWSSITGKPVRDLKEHTHRVYAIAFNPTDGRSFITGSYDNTCRLWDTRTGEPLRTPLRHPVPVRSLAFSPNGRTILTGCGDGSAQFWDVLEETSVGEIDLRHPDAPGLVEFSPDGRLALDGELGPGTDLGRVNRRAGRSPPSPSDGSTGRILLSRRQNRFDTLRGQSCPDLADSYGLVCWTSPCTRRLGDGHRVPAACERVVRYRHRRQRGEGSCSDGTRRCRGQPRVELDGIGPVLSIAFHPGGRIVAAGTRSREVWLQDIGTGRLERTGPIQGSTTMSGPWRSVPTARRCSPEPEKHRAEFWDVGTMRKLPQPLEHEKAVYAVAYSPDGRTVLTGSEDMTARLWDAVTHQPQGTPLMHEGTVYAVAFQPPGGKLVLTGSGDRTARLWETSTGRPVGEPLQHSGRVLAVAFSPDGRLIATGCGDGTVHFWDAAHGAPDRIPLAAPWARPCRGLWPQSTRLHR